MASHINFTETAAKEQARKREAKRLADALSKIDRLPKSRWQKFWKWLNTPLWGKK